MGNYVGPGSDDQSRDTSPGHEHEPNRRVKALLPDVRDQFYLTDSGLYFPGILILQNLVDGRRVTLDTHEEDSEIPAIRQDGLVLYRVSDEIFSAHIEGDKLSVPSRPQSSP